MRRFAAVVSASGCSIYRLGLRAPLALGTVAAIANIEELLEQNARAGDELTLYCDFAEESYTRSALPRLWSPAMRGQLLQRRLAQQFPDHPYRTAVVVPAGGLRPPEYASLIALPDVVQVQGLLVRARERGVRVPGMWPLSQLLAGLAPRGQDTLLTLQLPSGLRHVLVMQGVAVFSRLRPDSGDAPGEWLDDAERTAQYLAVQGWVPAAPLPAHIWHSREDVVVEDLRDTLSNVDLAGVHAVPDVLQRALAGKRPVQGQLLPSQTTADWRAARIARFAMAASAGGLAATLVYAGVTEWQTREVRQQAAADLAAAQRAGGETARVLATAQGNIGESGMAQATVQTWNDAVRRQPQAQVALQHLSGVLTQFPRLSLDRIVWRAGRPATLECEAPPVPAGEAPAAAVPAEPASAPAWPQRLEIALRASLPATVALRERLDTQQRFEAALRAQGWKLRVTKPFVELGAGAPGSGLLGEPTPATMEACATVIRP
jgi:hypothetical protein